MTTASTLAPSISKVRQEHVLSRDDTTKLNERKERKTEQRGVEGTENGVHERRNRISCLQPQTPGDRIAFADLIANPEDELSRIINATPNEQVEWRHVPSSSIDRASIAFSQRGKKRAHSSSPMSSAKVGRSKYFPNDAEPLDLESISRSLRTPNQDDPALALWSRYADTTDRGDNQESALPLLPPMLSSPNTPYGMQKTDGLRRTASCGREWPVSTTKKRKVIEQDPHGRIKCIFAANKDVILGKDQPKHSRVSILVDSIQQTLAHKPVSMDESPSSSSPVPERRSSFQHSSHKDSRLHTALGSVAEVAEDIDLETIEEQHDLSSEYDDVDFDADDPDLIEALDNATTKSIPLNAATLDTAEILLAELEPDQAPHPEISMTTSLPRSATASQDLMYKSPSSSKLKQDSLDEFDDDDVFATELVQLVNKVESQEIAAVTKASSFQNPPDHQSDDFDDFSDDGIYDDLLRTVNDTTAHATNSSGNSKSQSINDHRTIKRYLVVEVVDGSYNTPNGSRRPEKILSIKDEKTRNSYTIMLRQSWYDTRCTTGSYVHLVGNFDWQGRCIVDDIHNMIILHPDHLISATVVADSFSCMRRATLQDRIKATNSAEAPQVYGHLIHEVFGEALKQNLWDGQSLRKIVWKLVPTYIESLYEIGVQPQDAVEYVMGKMPELQGWAAVFINANLVPDAQIRDRNGALVPMAINKLLELEEHVWSPMYGLKGNIDATVQARLQLPGDQSPRTLTVPLELKTGKRDTNEMHRAQTALYTLLLSDRYDINVTSGILYYLETAKTFRIEGIRNEIRHMIIQRNELACYVHDKLALPPMLRKEHLCKRCYAQTSCFTYHKLTEGGDAESSGLRETFNEVVGHLKPVQQKFFKKWDDLLTKEERDSMKFRRELWTMLSTEREALGRCFANVMIEPGSAFESNTSPKINRYTYSFIKPNSKPGFSFVESQIAVGEPIVVSDEKGHFALANGYVTNVRPTRITVAVDRRLQNARRRQRGFDAEANQVFSGIMQVGSGQGLEDVSSDGQPTWFRIDKDEFANGMATARNNVLRIMEKDLFRAKELRQLIIENKPPLFKTESTAYVLSGPASQQQLNEDQRRAIEKVMSARDYALVLGMPGTGKTTTIAHIIRALVSQGKSVLLTSYTHTAVDNILLKIKDDDIPVLRLGAVGKIHPDVQQFADLSGIPKTTMKELEHSWMNSKVVATTCLGINHAIFNHRKFDYCIVDEASQITLPVCLGPIRLASTFILVGDHYQLPPLVQNKEAQEGGLDVSLFKLLSDAQPTSVVNLEHQYRMAEDIMIFSNLLVYSGRLRCGTSAVASRVLQIPNLAGGLEAHHRPSCNTSTSTGRSVPCTLTQNRHCWLRRALLPMNRCMFLNTDTLSDRPGQLGSPELHSGSGTRITNPTEAILTAQLLTTLVRSGVSAKSIGVITFYRSQLALLKTTVKATAGTTTASNVEMHTADKYQGRDKEVIILSCVRSNETCAVGELLKDWRRVNVALTRARSKLIIIGSARTLGGSGIPVLEGMIRIVNQKRWLLDLPVGSIDSHQFEGSVTQTQTQYPAASNTVAETVRLESHKTQSAKSKSRTPLAETTANAIGRTGGGNNTKIPSKVIQGSVDLDKILDKHPIMKNIADELLSVAGRN